MFKLYHIFTMCVCVSIFLAAFFLKKREKAEFFKGRKSYMGRLENVLYDTWWEYWNGMENMNHVMWTCSLEPISSTIAFTVLLLCVRACVCLYVFLCTSTLISFLFLFLYLQACLSERERAVAITNCDDFSSHNISLQFTLWFRHVLCGDSALFSHFVPPSGVCSTFSFIFRIQI